MKRQVVITFDEPTGDLLKLALKTVKEQCGDEVKVMIFVLKGPIRPPWWDVGRVKGSLADPGYREVLIEAIKAGHIVGGHGTGHIDYRDATKEEIVKDIEDCLKALKDLYIEAKVPVPDVWYFRPPYFSDSKNFWDAVKELQGRNWNIEVILGGGKGGHEAGADVGWLQPHLITVQRRITRLCEEGSPGLPVVLTVHPIPGSAITLSEHPGNLDNFERLLQWLVKELNVKIVSATQKVPNSDKTVADSIATRLPEETEKNVRSTENRSETGVEAGPVVPRTLLPALLNALPQFGRLHINGLLPSSGPHGTQAVGPLLVPQTTTMGNAIAASAMEFRTTPGDSSTTKAVVLVMKTDFDTEKPVYEHDFGICPRYHGYSLEHVRAMPLPPMDTKQMKADSPWFWFSRIYNPRLRTYEEACQFVAFVSESRRQITVDSRWIATQYSPYWRRSRKPYDYVLNVQVWSYGSEETLKLVRSVLQKLEELSWNLEYANRQEPTQPTVFVEEAWLTDNNTVFLSVWNNLGSPRLACFHGTRRFDRQGPDDFFEEQWRPVFPGRTLLQLPLGPINNAVIYCEMDGFVDKVYVSVDRQSPARLVDDLEFVGPQQQPLGAGAKINISWPPAQATITVLRDHLDMPNLLDKGGLVAINGTFSNAPVGSSIIAFVHTDKWYLQEQKVAVHGDLWGTRVYLAGQENNKHWISVGIYKDGKELARHEVGPIYRLDPVPGDAPRGVQQLPQAPLQDIIVDADKWKGDGGVHRWPDGCITIGGGPDGPHNRGGTAWCQVDLPVDASTLKLKMSIWHGLETQEGKGVHSRVAKGTVTVFVNDVQVHTIVCQHRHKFGDFWPEDRAELGRELPEMDLRIKGITGKSLTIKLVASPWTCMDLRTFNVKPVPRSALLDQNTAPQPTLQE